MHVPFSMSDEPDLGDEFKGIGGDYEHIEPTTFPRCITCFSGPIGCDCPTFISQKPPEPTFHGYTLADIEELEDDLMYARDALRDVLDWMECSQSRSALRAIVNRGLRQ